MRNIDRAHAACANMVTIAQSLSLGSLRALHVMLSEYVAARAHGGMTFLRNRLLSAPEHDSRAELASAGVARIATVLQLLKERSVALLQLLEAVLLILVHHLDIFLGGSVICDGSSRSMVDSEGGGLSGTTSALALETSRRRKFISAAQAPLPAVPAVDTCSSVSLFSMLQQAMTAEPGVQGRAVAHLSVVRLLAGRALLALDATV
jgi:hypothetical protein